MPPHEKPDPPYEFDLDAEVDALRGWREEDGRLIPARDAEHVLLATWNIANLGVQERRDKDFDLIGEILGWFDIVALQEVNDDSSHLRELLERLPPEYRALLSAPAGNRERLAFIYDATRLQPGLKIGSLTIPDTELQRVELPGVDWDFKGFNRHPYVASFHVDDTIFLLVNVHSVWASSDPIGRRQLETFAIAKWADERHESDYAYTHNILPLGDFNLPRMEEGDEIYDALTSRGLELPPYSTKIGGSNLDGDKQYDQIAFFPGQVTFENRGVFDFDQAVFREIWDPDSSTYFFQNVRYFISDHRPLWAQFRPKTVARELGGSPG
jgi:endonuclease/exonuclease/phosphatase family metal-dependent hydrolase